MRLRGIVFVLLLTLVLKTGAFAVDYPAPSRTQETFNEYMNNINEKLQKNWIPPDFLEEAHIKVFFKLDRHGNIISGDILQSSGDSIYDESVVEAINKSEPFGEFPENSTRETITINYNFDTSIVKTDRMKQYYELSKRYYSTNREEALKYINLAIAEVQGDENAYFLYNRRGKIKEAMGDHYGANEDYNKYREMKKKADIRRIHALKYQAEAEDTAFAYYYLAFAYEQLAEYDNAIAAIDKAIERTDLNNQYKRYRLELKSKLAQQ